MKNFIIPLCCLFFLCSNVLLAQRSIRIGYIDTEYVLESVPEYQTAVSELDSKVNTWKSDIEKKLNAIEEKKKQLNNESVLLTKELFDERMEDILFEETEILDYQRKRFGPEGDLYLQKKQLIQPVQDQIFSAVQDIAKTKRYDFIFDKSSDVVMLYSANKYDISDQVIKAITRSSKRKQANTKSEKKALEDEEVVPVVDNELDERQKALEEKKAQRAKLIEDRKKAQIARRDSLRLLAEAKRKGVSYEELKMQKENTSETLNKTKTTNNTDEISEKPSMESKSKEAVVETEKKSTETQKTTNKSSIFPPEDSKSETEKPLTEREKRKKALDEKRQRILKQRAEAKRKQDSINNLN
jgi:Skp family chaperone for outer membrane proteins